MSSLTAEKQKSTATFTWNYQRTKQAWMVARVVLLSFLVVFALFPVIWIFSAAINPSQGLANQTLIPQNVDSIDDLLVNFRELLNTPRYPFWTWMFNSVVVASITSMGMVMVTSFSAYAFSRFRFYGRRSLMLFMLLVQVFPNLLAMTAIFLLLLQLGQYIPALGLNTIGGLILVYMGGGIASNVYLMKGFFDSVPKELDESAKVDGATQWQTYWLVIFPLVRPILIVVGILAFVGTFNEPVLSRILLTDINSKTLMAGLFFFIGDNFGQNWGVFAAGAVIGMIPTLLTYIFFQNQIVGGLTQGAVKG